MPQPIYLDYAATTPVRREVCEAMEPFYGARFGNPSSTHRWGREARAALDGARERVARCLGADAEEICFTSCGTEGDNLAILGTWRALRPEGKCAVVSTPTEHKAVLGAVHQAAHDGAEERMLEVGPDGLVDIDSFDALVDGDVAICSVMWVNNEIGTIQPIAELAMRAKARGVIFHTDGVQAFGKLVVDARTTPFDLCCVTGSRRSSSRAFPMRWSTRVRRRARRTSSTSPSRAPTASHS